MGAGTRYQALISADPAVYARLPRVQRDESRTQALDRLELIGIPVGRPDPHRALGSARVQDRFALGATGRRSLIAAALRSVPWTP